jgi:hypothetical protein
MIANFQMSEDGSILGENCAENVKKHPIVDPQMRVPTRF